MPASNMGSASGTGNPNTGAFVLMNALSGPKGSPFDKDSAGNYSTGALCTGIGFGGSNIIGPTAPQSIKDRGFTYGYTPGLSKPDATNASNAIFVFIGGGRSGANVGGSAPTNPWATGYSLAGFGGGCSRDAGAGPAFTGFNVKMCTATAAVAIGADVEAGFANRTGKALVAGQSCFASNDAAQAAPTSDLKGKDGKELSPADEVRERQLESNTVYVREPPPFDGSGKEGVGNPAKPAPKEPNPKAPEPVAPEAKHTGFLHKPKK